MTVVENEKQVEVSKPNRYAETFEKAADYIEKYGWTNTNDEALEGADCIGLPTCAGIAIDHFDNIKDGQASKFFSKYIGAPHNCIMFWNDRPGRTKEEVIRKLREASALPEGDSHDCD